MTYIVKTTCFLFYFVLVLLCGFVIGYSYKFNNSQAIYDRGVKDGKKFQLQQDEYLYKKIREKYNLGIEL